MVDSFAHYPDYCFEVFKRKDPAVKLALGDIYGNIYDDEDKGDSTGYEVDHIIKKSIKPDEFKKIIEKVGLGPKFQIDSLTNLVPTNRLFNNLIKGRRILPDLTYSMIFLLTFDNAERVYKLIKKYQKSDSINTLMGRVELISAKFGKSYIDIIDFIIDKILRSKKVLNNFEEGIDLFKNKRYREAESYFKNFIKKKDQMNLGLLLHIFY